MWRRPAALWAPLALALALLAPALMFRGEGRVGQIAIAAVALGVTAALVSLVLAAAIGRLPRSRREVMSQTLRICMLAAAAAPFAVHLLLSATEDAQAAPIGLPLLLPFALLPLAACIGLPAALMAALLLSYVAFRRQPAPEHGLAEREPTDPSAATSAQAFEQALF